MNNRNIIEATLAEHREVTVDDESSPVSGLPGMFLTHSVEPRQECFECETEWPCLFAQLATIALKTDEELAAWREFGTYFEEGWEQCEGGPDGIRHWEECVYCHATRNDTRNGSYPPTNNVNGHERYCPTVRIAAIKEMS